MPEEQVPEHTAAVWKPRSSRYVVIIPVLNEGERIRRQIVKMAPLTAAVDIAIVDGGSTDGSLEADELQRHGVRALLVKTGHGRLSAQLRVGLAWAMREGYDGVILIDGNDKDNPAAIPAFIDALDRGSDHVQGSRYLPGGAALNTPFLRHWGVKLLHAPLISLAARFRYTDTTNGFRAYSRRFLTDPAVQPFRDVFSGYELHYYLAIRAGRLGFRVTEVPVERRYPERSVPTHIRGWRGNVRILKTLLAACAGHYDPSP
jgi:dolichol-phosphate mannosyltransferase